MCSGGYFYLIELIGMYRFVSFVWSCSPNQRCECYKWCLFPQKLPKKLDYDYRFKFKELNGTSLCVTRYVLQRTWWFLCFHQHVCSQKISPRMRLPCAAFLKNWKSWFFNNQQLGPRSTKVLSRRMAFGNFLANFFFLKKFGTPSHEKKMFEGLGPLGTIWF